MRYSKDILKYYLILLLGLILVACGPEEPTPTEFSPTSTIQAPTATFSPEPPTPTPEPLAAIVNGEEITLAEFESELQRFFASQDLDQLDLSEDAELIVLQELIDRLLFAQSARQEGFVLNDEDLQARMAALVAEVGGEDEMAKWLEEQGYNQSNFIEALRTSIAAAWMRDLILSEVPETAEQVHARQIFTTDQDQADRIFTQLQGEADFTALAAELDPLFQGDLGWFPRGYLLETDLEDVAFDLQSGEFSQVIQTRLGFHILQVIERESDRPLDPDAYLTLQIQALKDWVDLRREESEIQIFIPVPQD